MSNRPSFKVVAVCATRVTAHPKGLILVLLQAIRAGDTGPLEKVCATGSNCAEEGRLLKNAPLKSAPPPKVSRIWGEPLMLTWAAAAPERPEGASIMVLVRITNCPVLKSNSSAVLRLVNVLDGSLTTPPAISTPTLSISEAVWRARGAIIMRGTPKDLATGS